MGFDMRARVFFPIYVLLLVLSFFSLIQSRNFSENSGMTSQLVEEEVVERDYPIWMDEFIDPPANVDPKHVYTFVCEYPMRRPDIFTTACADFGESVSSIEWTSWSAQGAEGRGVYGLNNCEPDCADGTIHSIKVRVWLEDVSTDGRNYFLNTLKIVPEVAFKGERDYANTQRFRLYNDVVIGGQTYLGATWDVASDWKYLPHMREDLPD